MITTEFKAPPRLAEPSLDGDAPEISVFLPVFNEEPNLRPLHEKLDQALAQLGRTAEIIYVDDGSTDGSLNVLREIAARRSARARDCSAAQLRPDAGDGRRHRRRAAAKC